MINHKYAVSQLTWLYRATLPVAGFYKDQAKEFIEVGEYGLALDTSADAFLQSHTFMPEDLYAVFEDLAKKMKLDRDPEYTAVAELRKYQAV